MKRHILKLISILGFILIISGGCSKDNSISKPSDIWDIDTQGIPKFVGIDYLELSKIYRISKFRSSIGHDYSDSVEHCRSMKHYFEPRNDIDWATIKLYSPITGIITRVDEEWAGTKIEIASVEYPAFRFSIFHINKSQPFKVDDRVTAGQSLGTHIGFQTMSDIAVIVNDPSKQGRMVSYFELMNESLFQKFSNRGVRLREDLIIPKTIRDASPLSCNGDAFTSIDTLKNWYILK